MPRPGMFFGLRHIFCIFLGVLRSVLHVLKMSVSAVRIGGAGAESVRSRIRKEFEGVRSADEAEALILEDARKRVLPDGFFLIILIASGGNF